MKIRFLFLIFVNMFKVGLTGNFYSGQNEVSEILKQYDVPVFNANLIAKFLINHSKPHIQEIKSIIGENSYTFGRLNLKDLNNNRDFDKILQVIEFDIIKSYEFFRKKYSCSIYTIFYYDFLFERGLDYLMNFNVNCFRPKHHRKYDMTVLTNLSDSIIDKILHNEMGDSKKSKRSDFVINNYNPNDDYKSDIVVGLEDQVFNLHKRIMAKKMGSY